MEARLDSGAEKRPVKNLPRSWPRRWVTTPQHAPCLIGHGERSERAGEGLEEVRCGRLEWLGQTGEGKCAIFFIFSDLNAITKSFGAWIGVLA